MIAISLQSGSSGNCTYVETEDAALLFDAGISGIEAERRLAQHGRDIRNIDALIISHDHADHIRYAGVYQRKYSVPVFISPRTLSAAEKSHCLGRMNDVTIFFPGSCIRFGSVSVQTVPTPHDGADGSVFVVSDQTRRLGIMTDLGHVFSGLREIISSLDAVFLESNYDPELLRKGPYPSFLKRRIQGQGGHLSNIEAAELLGEGKRLQWACLAHLSEKNNAPDLALRTHRSVVHDRIRLYAASRHAVSPIMNVRDYDPEIHD